MSAKPGIFWMAYKRCPHYQALSRQYIDDLQQDEEGICVHCRPPGMCSELPRCDGFGWIVATREELRQTRKDISGELTKGTVVRP